MSTKLFDLTGKTALITGGTHGIGMAIATGLAEAGATIIINERVPEKLEASKLRFAEGRLPLDFCHKACKTTYSAEPGWCLKTSAFFIASSFL